MKDSNVFSTDIYTATTIKTFTCSYIKKGLIKYVYAFLIKLATTTKQLIRRNYFNWLKKSGNFFTE